MGFVLQAHQVIAFLYTNPNCAQLVVLSFWHDGYFSLSLVEYQIRVFLPVLLLLEYYRKSLGNHLRSHSPLFHIVFQIRFKTVGNQISEIQLKNLLII